MHQKVKEYEQIRDIWKVVHFIIVLYDVEANFLAYQHRPCMFTLAPTADLELPNSMFLDGRRKLGHLLDTHAGTFFNYLEIQFVYPCKRDWQENMLKTANNIVQHKYNFSVSHDISAA